MKKIFENIKRNQFRVIDENRFAAANPEGNSTFIKDVPDVWNNPTKVEELKKSLESALNAGNFDIAHKLVEELYNYHN